MFSQIRWLLRRTMRKAWVRVVSFAVFAIATVIATRLLSPLIPDGWARPIGADAVDQLLGILASSMLAVTTFSLSVAVSAFASASSTATPRATRLLQEDRTTQNVLSTFLGAFIFGLVGIILLKAGYFGNGGVLLLFVATALVVALVVAALLQWISHLMSFGRMGDTLDRVERASADALSARLDMPYLGGRPWVTTPPGDVKPLTSPEVGYIQHVDMATLERVIARHGLTCWLEALPGQFVHRATPLLHTRLTALSDEERTELQRAFIYAKERTFEQDPRFGVAVLAEIASRALSPAVNDPGTAIDVMGRLVRVLSQWDAPATLEVQFPSLVVKPIEPFDILADGFRPIARDGAGLVEVQRQLQEALVGLAVHAPAVFREPSKALSREAISRAEHAGIHPNDLERIRVAADHLAHV